MIITKLDVQKKNKDRYNLYIDGQFKTGVHVDIVLSLGLYVNQEFDEDYYNLIVEKEILSKAKNDAVRFINYKMRSRYEVEKKLKDKEYSPEVIEKTMKFLDEFKFVNDLRYTKTFIHDKLTINKHSLRRIQMDLRRKGINKELFDKALEEINEEENVNEVIDDNLMKMVIKKKSQYESRGKFNEYEINQKLLQFLCNKGFSFKDVKDAIEKSKEYQ